jgi:hypothetical protein
VGAIAIGRLAVNDAAIPTRRAGKLDVGSLKVQQLEIAGQRWPDRMNRAA